MSEVTAFPLTWPSGWKRTAPSRRARAKFGKAHRLQREDGQTILGARRELTISEGVKRILSELSAMGISNWNVIISTNLRLRNDGLPHSSQSTFGIDPGAAVYWKDAGRKRCIAVDRYDRIADNLGAIAATLAAMRAIERHGGAEILDRAFTGFVALAAPEQPFQVLGVGANASSDDVEDAYRKLAMKHHPDRGGDSDQMARINAARDAMLSSSSGAWSK